MKGVRRHASRLFAHDGLENDAKMGRDSARIDAQQTAIALIGFRGLMLQHCREIMTYF
jgi:hypothetical protein